MVVRKKTVKEEQELYLGNKDVSPEKVEDEIARIKEGQDAPLTEQIYGDSKSYLGDAKQALFVKDGEIRSDDDPLIEFIEAYQPSVMVDRQKFYRRLLEILENWK
jgi:hypothetical protein